MPPSLKIKRMIELSKIILRGISQVMLLNNPLTGFLFLVGIFYNSWMMGIGALIGVFTGTITALALDYRDKDVKDGLYGFNGALAGVALFFFFKADILLIPLVIAGSFLSSIIMNHMIKRKLSPYTFPFVLSTWALIILIKLLDLVPEQAQGLFKAVNLDMISALSMGFGQVMFQASIITGIIFFIAILINSRMSAIYAFIGSFIGMLLALGLSFPLNLVNMGIFGFNGVLCGIAFADNKRYSWLYVIISIIASVLIIYGMTNLNIIALTAPFVFAAWITLALRKMISQNLTSG